MKSIIFLLLGCLCLHALNAQKIQLNKGDEFTYRTSVYQLNNTLAEDGSVKKTTESIRVYQLHFNVKELINEKYRLTAQYEIVNDYSRRKDSGDEQWKSENCYNVTLRDSNTRNPGPEYQVDFILSNMGDVSDINVISSIKDKRESINNPDSIVEVNFRMYAEELFNPLLEKINNDENIKKKYFIRNIQNNRVVLNRTEEDSYKPESIYDTQTGLLLEKNVMQDNLVMDQFVKIQHSNGDLEERKEKSVILSLMRTNLIFTNNEPYSCIFKINEEEIDTTFSKTNVTIRGKIIHPNQNREVSIDWAETVPNSYYRYSIVKGLEEDNTFEIRLNMDKMQKITLSHGHGIDFYLTPGDNLFITVDMDALDKSFVATGSGSNNINYGFRKFLFEESEKLSTHELNNQAKKKYIELTPKEFKEYFFNALERKQQFLEENKKWVDPQIYLAEFWKNQIDFVEIINGYPRYQKMYREEAGLEPYTIDNSEFFDTQFYSLIHPDNDMMAYADDYDHFIREYVFFILDVKMKELTGKGNIITTDNFYDQLYNSHYGYSGSLFSGYTQYILKYQTVSDALWQANWDTFKDLYNRFILEYPNTPKAENLAEAFKKAEKVAPGQPAFNFELSNFEGEKVKLSDFKGKVVYLNFIGVWGKSFSSYFQRVSNKVQEVFKDEDIVFVYIILKQDFARSKEYIEKMNIGGVKLITQKKEEETIIRDKYFFNGIPCYYIIDKTGKIVQRQAPGPSEIVVNHSILLDALEPH